LLEDGYLDLLWSFVAADASNKETRKRSVSFISRCLSASSPGDPNMCAFLKSVGDAVSESDAASRISHCDSLNLLLNAVDSENWPSELEQDSDSWLLPFVRLGEGILLSRSLSPVDRQTGLLLLSHVCRLLPNLRWTKHLSKADPESLPKFFLLLARLSCLELQLLFDDDSDDVATLVLIDTHRCLAPLCLLVENLIGAWKQKSIRLTNDQMGQLRLSHIALFEKLNGFLVTNRLKIKDALVHSEDSEALNFQSVLRLYGFLANDDEIAQTEEFANGVGCVLEMLESDSISFSTMDFLCPGLYLLSLDEEFFEEVSVTILPLILAILESRHEVPTSCFSIFMNLVSFGPEKTLREEFCLRLCKICTNTLKEENDVNYCYACALYLHLLPTGPLTEKKAEVLKVILCGLESVALSGTGTDDDVNVREELLLTSLQLLNKIRNPLINSFFDKMKCSSKRLSSKKVVNFCNMFVKC